MPKNTSVIVAGTGSAIEVNLGFIPDYVEVTNLTTRTKLNFEVLDETNVGGIATAASGARVTASGANGVIVTTSDVNATMRGFTLGAGATVNVTSNDLLVKAGLYDYI